MESSKLLDINTVHHTAMIFNTNSCEIEDHATGKKNKTNDQIHSFNETLASYNQDTHCIGRRKHASEFIREICEYSSKTAERTGKR